MPVTINASTSTGLVQSADTSGVIELQTNGTTVATVNTSNNVQFRSSISVGNATPTTSGAGITFPATQSASSDANTLDDYEEGTWTPTYSSGVTSPSYTGTTGLYVKVGRLVTFTFRIQLNGGSANGNQVKIAGLPFTVSSTSGQQGGAAFGYNGNFLSTGAVTMFTEDNSTNIVFYTFGGGVFVGTSATNISATIHGYGHYYV